MSVGGAGLTSVAWFMCGGKGGNSVKPVLRLNHGLLKRSDHFTMTANEKGTKMKEKGQLRQFNSLDESISVSHMVDLESWIFPRINLCPFFSTLSKREGNISNKVRVSWKVSHTQSNALATATNH